jgi:DNA replication and repair protein RecF
MHLDRLTVRGFRNLRDGDYALPARGAILLGANAQGKTNLLEAIGYPTLFRSLRGAADTEVAAFGGEGFRLEAGFHDGARPRMVAATVAPAMKRKTLTVDGAEVRRLSDAVGEWLSVAFLPRDVALAAGAAAERRRYLDRLLSLASRGYLRALTRYRAALAQRNAALRQGRAEVARAFDAPLAEAGAIVVASRRAWSAEAAGRFAAEFAALGEEAPAALRYRGNEILAEAGEWPALLEAAHGRDLARRMTTLGPHRDDLVLDIGGRPLREFGSTGQQRSAAVALKLLELGSLERARGAPPALLLDDVFAELDSRRQRRLATRLLDGVSRQVIVTAPRTDELPGQLDLPVWTVRAGVATPA